MKGVTKGFHIVDCFDFAPAEVDNYALITGPELLQQVETQIANEITEGWYVRVAQKLVQCLLVPMYSAVMNFSTLQS